MIAHVNSLIVPHKDGPCCQLVSVEVDSIPGSQVLIRKQKVISLLIISYEWICPFGNRIRILVLQRTVVVFFIIMWTDRTL